MRQQLTNQSVVVDVSIDYINERIRGYEMRDANCTGLMASILRARLRFCKTVTAAGGTVSNRSDFPKVCIFGVSLDHVYRMIQTSWYARATIFKKENGGGP
jgi:hypothetical protein